MKKSKILLTLVVLVLVCSMLFALVACNKDDADKKDDTSTQDTTPEPKPEPKPDPKPTPKPEPVEPDYSDIHMAFSDALVNSVKLDTKQNKVGFAYGISVPVANTAEGKSREIFIDVKGKLNVATANENKVELAVKESIAGAAATEIFTVLLDNDALYVLTPAQGYKIPGLRVDEMLSGAKFDDVPMSFKSIIEMVTGVAGAVLFGEATETVDGTVTNYSVDVDLEKLEDVLPMVGDMIIEKVPFLSNTVEGLMADLVEFLATLDINLKAKVENEVVTEFKIDVATEWGEGHVTIDPQLAVDYAPTFTDVAARENVLETNLLNFTLEGAVELDMVYNFKINANIDVFSVVSNLVRNVKAQGVAQAAEDARVKEANKKIEADNKANGTKNPLEVAKTIELKVDDIFNGTKTNLQATANYTDGEGVVTSLGIIIDPALGDGIYFTEKVGDAVAQSTVINPQELIADKIAADKAAADKAAQENAGKVAGPALSTYEPTDADYAAAKAAGTVKPEGTVEWIAAADTTYEVMVGGVDKTATVSNGKASVKATSGQVVSVVAVAKDGTKSLASTVTYIDGRATARAVAKAVSMLMAIDYNYETYYATLKTFYIGEFVDALRLAIDADTVLNKVDTVISLFGEDVGVKMSNAAYFDPANTEMSADTYAVAFGYADAAALKTDATAVRA